MRCSGSASRFSASRFVIAAIFVIALYSHTANRRGALALSDNLLDMLDAQIAQRVAAFLDPSERILRVMRSVASDVPVTERRASDERYAIQCPQGAAADRGGLCWRHHRQLPDGAAAGRRGPDQQIVNQPGNRRIFLIDRNAAGDEMARREDPTDDYDPRTRPWFTGALDTGDVYWTGIYIFFSDHKPGITVSSRVPEPGGLHRVFGVDVTLDELSRFLAVAGDRPRRARIDHGQRWPRDRGAELGRPSSSRSGTRSFRPRSSEIGDPRC